MLARWQNTIVDDAGNVQGSASIEVRAETGGQPLVSIYSDRDGLTPLGNPFTADSEGFAAFHVSGGAYQIVATKGGFTRTWRYVGIGTNSENDFVDFVKAPTVQIFTASGTYTKPINPSPRFVKITVIGGGGASGGAPATVAAQGSGGGGGGGGGAAIEWLLATAVGATETVTVGAGGTAGAAGAAGNAGGTSSFGSLLSATGGGGGGVGGPSGSALILGGTLGGLGLGGDLNIRGGPGFGSAWATSGAFVTGGNGGNSFFGGGRSSSGSGTQSVGNPGGLARRLPQMVLVNRLLLAQQGLLAW
jgi:hypothetical protein